MIPMVSAIGAFDAKTQLAELLDQVERGEELVIARRGRPVARLVPPSPAPPQRSTSSARCVAV